VAYEHLEVLDTCLESIDGVYSMRDGVQNFDKGLLIKSLSSNILSSVIQTSWTNPDLSRKLKTSIRSRNDHHHRVKKSRNTDIGCLYEPQIEYMAEATVSFTHPFSSSFPAPLHQNPLP
jgi:hypothetical protein